jgi:hypothetical protein
VTDSESRVQTDVPPEVLGGEPVRKRPPPIWCFQSRAILEAMLKEAENPELMPAPEEFLNETKGKCLNRAASERLTASGAVRWVRTHNIYRGQLPFLDELDERLEQSLGLAAVHGGAWQITSYDHGEQYESHLDCVVEEEDAETAAGSKFKRMVTALVFLTDVEEGGETEFTNMGFKVKPQRGKAVIWRNLDEDGNCNPLTLHSANPVIKGRKVIMQRWYYETATNVMNFPPGAPPVTDYLPGTPLIACDAEHACRQYNDWTVNWANWKGFN